MRYTVEVSKVDYGSHVVGYDSRKDALASAILAAYAMGGHTDMLSAKQSFESIKHPACPRVTYQPSLKQWAITIRKHKGA